MNQNRFALSIILTLFVLLFIVNHSSAQWWLSQEESHYKAWILINRIQSEYSGYLLESKDSSIVFEGYTYIKGTNENTFENLEIPYQDISRIYVRKKGKLLRGAFYGALVGALIGFASAFEVYGPIPDFEINFEIVVYSTVLGAGIGAGIGSIKKEVSVYHDPERYQENKDLLINYVKNAPGDNKNREKQTF